MTRFVCTCIIYIIKKFIIIIKKKCRNSMYSFFDVPLPIFFLNQLLFKICITGFAAMVCNVTFIFCIYVCNTDELNNTKVEIDDKLFGTMIKIK